MEIPTAYDVTRYRKAIVAAAGVAVAVANAVVAIVQDGKLDGNDIAFLMTAFGVSVGVERVPNNP